MINKSPSKTKLNARQKLLCAAAEAFAVRGFDATTTRSIAESADANIALIAYHFGGKDGLYDAVLADWIAGLCAAIDRETSTAIRPADRTIALVTAFLRYTMLEAPAFAALVARESIVTGPSPTAQRTSTALDPVRELIDTAVASSESAITDDSQCLALLLRLAAPMPSIDGGATPVEAYEQARQRALAILELSAAIPEDSAPPPAPARVRYPISPPSTMDFVD